MLNPTAPLPLKDPSLFRQACCIDGQWVQAASGKTLPVRNPATGTVVGEVPALGAAETRQAIEAVLRRPVGVPGPAGKVTAPGMLASHYAPRARLRLDADAVRAGEAVLDFGGHLRGQGNGPSLDLSPTRDLAEAAARLFGCLRRLDDQAEAIAVAPIPPGDLGEAIRDRLTRAAAPRDQD